MSEHAATPAGRGWALPMAISALLAGVLGSGLMVWRASEAAFTATTVNPTNSWTAGTISLTDDDSNTALFTATGLKPGDTAVKCIKVTYGGNITSGVLKLYSAAPTGTLGGYINMTVEVGSGGTYASCTGFTASSTIINNQLLTTVGGYTNYSNGVSSGWSPAVGDANRTFRFTYTLSASTPDAQQGATCTMPFTWETQA